MSDNPFKGVRLCADPSWRIRPVELNDGVARYEIRRPCGKREVITRYSGNSPAILKDAPRYIEAALITYRTYPPVIGNLEIKQFRFLARISEFN